jgi:CrcB protein
LADPLIYLVVFCGGTLGTALRYGTTLLLPGRMSASGALNAVHMATFLVNMLTAFGFAMLAAYMAQASWIRKRTRRVASQGLGTGLCGGLSTLSTLAMEAVVSLGQGKVGGAALYLLLTFGCGLLLTYLGAYLGLSLASGHRGRAARTQAGGGLGSTGPEAGKADSEESSAVSLDWTDESAADRRTAGDSGQDGRPLGQESPSFEPAPITAEVPLVPDPVWGEAR